MKYVLPGEPDLTKEQVWFILSSNRGPACPPFSEDIFIANSIKDLKDVKKKYIEQSMDRRKSKILLCVNELQVDEIIRRTEKTKNHIPRKEKKIKLGLLRPGRDLPASAWLSREEILLKGSSLRQISLGIENLRRIKKALKSVRDGRGEGAYADAREGADEEDRVIAVGENTVGKEMWDKMDEILLWAHEHPEAEEWPEGIFPE